MRSCWLALPDSKSLHINDIACASTVLCSSTCFLTVPHQPHGGGASVNGIKWNCGLFCGVSRMQWEKSLIDWMMKQLKVIVGCDGNEQLFDWWVKCSESRITKIISKQWAWFKIEENRVAIRKATNGRSCGCRSCRDGVQRCEISTKHWFEKSC